jgi:DNA-binding NarL/FixJ family response regulator
MRHVAVAVIAVGTLATDLAVGWDWRIAMIAGILVLAFGEAIGFALRPKSQPSQAPFIPPARRSDLHPLTRRQAEIARLVAEGLTNKEMAKRLWLSERGAEGNIQNIYNKLGIHKRSELTRWVLEHDLRSPVTSASDIPPD